LIIANATSSALRNAHLMQKLKRDHREAQVAQSKAVERAEHERVVSTELRKTKEFLESLIEASVDAIVAADLTGTIILYNKGAERIYGRKADEVVGRLHVDKLYPDGVAREVMRRIRSADYGGVGRLESMHSAAIDKDGNAIPISLSAAMIYEHDKPTATVGIFTDLREKIQAEERLAQVQKKLEVSEKQALLAELAGTAAHELNQPLTSVMGYGELLIRRLPAGTPERNAAQVIMQEAERMANLVRRIGKITRYETKSYVGDQRILDLDRATDDGPDNTR
jgi:PAS domain S-box-containing protein